MFLIFFWLVSMIYSFLFFFIKKKFIQTKRKNKIYDTRVFGQIFFSVDDDDVTFFFDDDQIVIIIYHNGNIIQQYHGLLSSSSTWPCYTHHDYHYHHQHWIELNEWKFMKTDCEKKTNPVTKQNQNDDDDNGVGGGVWMVCLFDCLKICPNHHHHHHHPIIII